MGVGVGSAGAPGRRRAAASAGRAGARHSAAVLATSALAVLIACWTNGVSAQQNGYYGVPLGELSRLHHGVRGTVFAVDARTLHIRDFHYDGEGPAAYFYASNSKTPGAQGFRIRDERGSASPLKRYRGKHITLTLPEGKTLHQLRWFYVWCEEFSVNFGDVRLNKNLELPKPHKIGALSGIHGVSSDPVVVVDAQTLLVPSFSYDGEAPDAKFWVGRGPKPSPQGIRVADENGKEVPLRRYEQKTLVLTLPGDLTVFDIGHFGVWCEAFAVDFGHVQIPRSLGVPPSLRMLGVQPQKQQQRSLQSHPAFTQGLSSPPESVLSLFNAAQNVRPTTYRPHTHRRQPDPLPPSGPSGPSGPGPLAPAPQGRGLGPGPQPASSNQDEAAVQILPSIPLLNFDQRGSEPPPFQQQPFQQQPFQQQSFQRQDFNPQERQQFQQQEPLQPTHRLQQLHELSVQQHRFQLQQQQQQQQQQPLRQQKAFLPEHTLKIQALQQSHLLQVQEQQRQREAQERQRQRLLQEQQFQDRPRQQQQQQQQQQPFFQDQQRQRQLEEERRLEQERQRHFQQNQGRDQGRDQERPRLGGVALPNAFAGLDITSIQPSQGIELTSPQQTQNFLSSFQLQPGSLQNAPLERVSPPSEQLLFKDNRDLYAINNLADSNVDVNNLERGGRSEQQRPFGNFNKEAFPAQQGLQQGQNYFQRNQQTFQHQQQQFPQHRFQQQQPFHQQPFHHHQQQQPFQQNAFQQQQPQQDFRQDRPFNQAPSFQQDPLRRLVQRQIQTFGPQSRSRFLLPHRASQA